MPHCAIVFVEFASPHRRAEGRDPTKVADRAGRLHALLRILAPSSGGSLVKPLNEGALLRFPTVDHAFGLASAVMREVSDAFSLRATVCAGRVVDQDGDVYGEPVHIASRLLGMAKPGQILTTRTTFAELSPGRVLRARHLGGRELRGVGRRVGIVEVFWDNCCDLTHVVPERTEPEAMDGRALSLEFEKVQLRCGATGVLEPVTVGRDALCMIVIDERHVSRHHLSIYARNGVYYVRDHSANGTWVVPPRGASVRIRNEETLLVGTGLIVPGVEGVQEGHARIRYALHREGKRDSGG
ncbi:MAG: FHA domain-containing protein, partial [Alphaproteobacteria bacterium]